RQRARGGGGGAPGRAPPPPGAGGEGGGRARRCLASAARPVGRGGGREALVSRAPRRLPASGPAAIARALAAPGWLAALAAVVAFACAKPPPRPAPPAVPAGSFYWEAVAPGGGVLFLLGSVHIGDGRALELDPRVESAWRRADELVVEVDTNALS